jgi:uncharacterized protein YjdB
MSRNRERVEVLKMKMPRILLAVILTALAIVGAASALPAQQGSPQTVKVKFAATPLTAPTLASIAIYPSANGGIGTSDGILTEGTEVPFFATGFYSDNSTQDLTTQVTWKSSETSVVTIGANTGLAVGAGAGGPAEITASLSGVTSNETPVTVEAGTLEGVAITPATAGVAVGSTMQLIAYANYEISGTTSPYPTVLADITHEVTWKSSNSSVASVSSAGVVTGVAAGTITISVTMSGFTGTPQTASVTVVPTPPNWTLTGDLFHQTAGQIAVKLNDGTVIIAGGEDSSNAVLDLAQIYTPSTGLFTPTTGNMVVARTLPVAALLPDGTVLIAGGGSGTGGGGDIESAEIYNPSTGMFTATANDMSAIRSGGATATLLNTGMVLVAGGGQAGTSADLYDPSTQTFTPTGPLNVARVSATATLLTSGDVLITGGHDPSSDTGGALSSAELYDTTTGKFTLLTATMAFAREFHTATLLTDGQVLIAGGTASTGSASTPPAYEELYDPTTQTFLQTGALNAPRIAFNSLLLGDGTVLIVGGEAPNDLTGLFGETFPPQATCEIYNPETAKFTFTANMSYSRAEFTATLLQNGSVLAAGGEGVILFPAPAEIFTPSSTSPTLVSIAVTPTTASIAAGDTQAFTATGTYSDTSTQNITSTVTWASSDKSAATIASTGVATGVAAGSSTITASLSGITSNSATLTVTAATLTSIAITPTTASIAVGKTQAFTATGTYSNSTTENITSTVTWASSNTAAATIASTGVATGVAAGSSTITAKLSGITSNSATLTVTAATLTSIAITPTTASIAAGKTQAFTATGTYSNSTTQNITSTVTWASSNTAAATIASTGVATGVAAGSSTVTAKLSGITSNSATLTVTAATLTSIAITPTTASIAAGKTQAFTATGTYSDKSTKSITSTVTWASSNKAAATIASTGVATGVAAGSSTITAKLSGITSNSATLTVTGAITVTLSPSSAKVALGGKQVFTATLSGTTNTALDWYVNGVLNGNSTQGTLTGCTTVAPRTCTYTAPSVDVPSPNPAVIKVTSVADPSVFKTADVTVTDSIAVTLSPSSARVALGGKQVFTATLSGTTNTALNWYVNGVLKGNSAQGTLTDCTTVAPRTCTYTAPPVDVPSPNPAVIKVASAADPSKYKTASVTVTDSIAVTLSPSSARVALGGKQVFTATLSGTTNTGLNWYVNGVLNGNAAQGALTGCTTVAPRTCTYTAPPVDVPSPNPAVIKVASAADPSKFKTASVTATDSIAVTLSPTSKSLALGGKQVFTATLSGTTNTGLNWYVNGVLNGNATQGTVTGCTTVTPLTCTYTAPPVDVPSPNPAVIKVASAADPSKFKTASVTVTDSIAVTLSPTSKSLALGGKQVFTATLSGTTNTGLNWYVNGVLNGNATQGTLTACTTVAPRTCTYTAPPVDVPNPNPAVIKVASAADPGKYKTADVTVTKP